MKPFEYMNPSSVEEALQLLGDDHTVAKAAGIDVLDMMKEGLMAPERLVNLRSIKELRGIRRTKGLSIGPSVTLAELAKHEALQTTYRALAQAADGAATPQIRNAATLGGNLCQRPRCWYFRSADFNCARKSGSECFAYNGENQYHAILANQHGCAMVHPSATAVALMALDAKIRIRSVQKDRSIALEDFFVLPSVSMRSENILQKGDLIVEIEVPEASRNLLSFYYKQKEKQSFDWPIAEAAVAFEYASGICSNPRIVLGAAAPVPLRAKEAERYLHGKTLTPATARAAAEEALRAATPLSGNTYKVAVFKAVVTRAICLAAGIDPMKS